MKVIKVQPNNKRKIRSLPVTGNYLVTDSSGMMRWAEPNDYWRLYAHTGGQRCLIANVRLDDTEHSHDLWLYTVLKQGEMQLGNEYGKPKTGVEDTLFEENRIHLDRTRKWYIRQFIPSSGKIGVKRFTGLPLIAWQRMWRKTIQMTDIEIYGLGNMQMKILYSGLQFNSFLKWPELQKDMGESSTAIGTGRTQWKVSETIIPWLQKYCQRGFIPFSDYDTMFPDAQDEFAYITDVA